MEHPAAGETGPRRVRHHFSLAQSALLSPRAPGPPQLAADCGGGCLVATCSDAAECLPLVPGAGATQLRGCAAAVPVPLSVPRRRNFAVLVFREADAAVRGWLCEAYDLTGETPQQLSTVLTNFANPAMAAVDGVLIPAAGMADGDTLRVCACVDTVCAACRGGAVVCNVSSTDDSLEVQVSLKWHTGEVPLPRGVPMAATQQLLFVGAGPALRVYYPAADGSGGEARSRLVPVAAGPPDGGRRHGPAGRPGGGGGGRSGGSADSVTQIVPLSASRVAVLTRSGRVYVVGVSLPFKDAAASAEAVLPPRSLDEPHTADHLAAFPGFLDPLVPSGGCLAALGCGSLLLLCPLQPVIDAVARLLRQQSSRQQQQHGGGGAPEGAAGEVQVHLTATSAQWLAREVTALAMAPPHFIFAAVAGDPRLQVLVLGAPPAPRPGTPNAPAAHHDAAPAAAAASTAAATGATGGGGGAPQ
eukprot:TRINITY_DN32972_c0_g1_i1.p1 TRINITY_DN32972_c0_g1~~TRINITY_DN32972_c0_g1_i1.p1  ORF type:complete len:498 (+),score=152.84 TRINITY_DN32972_c0_g1_i1:81-1496(+)